jgi:carboxypeptidase PM20D1
MKTMLKLVGLVFLGLLAVVVIRAWPSSPAPRAAGKAPAGAEPDARAIAERLAQAIRIKTISHQDEKLDDRAAFAAFRSLLESAYPRVHATFRRELVGGDGLLYQWQGSDPALAPILFMAHQDVVPVEPATEARWTHPAFAGVIADGYVWGRGAMDDKGPLICLFEAFESLLAEGFVPARSVWFASGFDEEVGGRRGALRISRELQARGIRFAWLLDEGGVIAQGIVPNVQRPVAGIAIAEKGYLSLELLARGEGGHSSMPPPDSAINVLTAALTRLQSRPFAPRLIPTQREATQLLAPEMPFLSRLVTKNLWLFSPLLVRELASRKETSPLVRTTIAPTILEAGVKENVVPTTARAVVNFRIIPGESIAQVVAHVRSAIDDDRISLKKLERSLSEPAPLSSTRGPGFKLVAQVVRTLMPESVVIPSVVNGATDSRHFQAIAKDVYRFTPRVLSKSDLKRVHGIDERAGVEDLAFAVRAYRELVRRGAAASQP